MKRKKLIVPLVLLMLVFLLLFSSCSGDGKSRIGVLNYSKAAEPALEGLRSGLEEYGYVEGKNLEIYYTGPLTDDETLGDEAERLLKKDIDLLYAMAIPASLAARKAVSGSDVPVVFGPVRDPVGSGVVDSLTNPGKGVTGVTFIPNEPKRLEYLKEIIPELDLIWVPYMDNDTIFRNVIQSIKDTGDKLGIRIEFEKLSSPEEVPGALANMSHDIDAVFLSTGSVIESQLELYIDFCLRRGIPLACNQEEGVYKGALLSYGIKVYDCGFQAARLVSQILKGSPPEELPVEIVELTLAINLDTAEMIGIEITDDLLRRALIVRTRG